MEKMVICKSSRPVLAALVKITPDIIISLDHPVETCLKLLGFGHAGVGDLCGNLLGAEVGNLNLSHFLSAGSIVGRTLFSADYMTFIVDVVSKSPVTFINSSIFLIGVPLALK